MASSRGTEILLPYQRAWVNDPAPMKIWAASRQIGKSFAMAMEAVMEAVAGRCNNLLVSASERQSKELMEKVIAHLRFLGIVADDLFLDRESREELRLPNGSRIVSLPASPNTVRGFSGHVYLDEFALHRDSREIWRALYPTITRGYRIRVASTPFGRNNQFYELFTHNPQFSKHRTTIYQARDQGLDIDIDRLREGISDPDAWAQEYECEFLDEATAFLTYELISGVETDSCLWSGTIPDTHEELYLGMDIGRKHDRSIIWTLERIGDVFWTREVMELHRAPFRVQREELFSRLSKVRRACIDATGLGMQLAEEARERFGSYRVEEITFSGSVKEDLAVSLRRVFEDRRVRIPPDRKIREDLHSVRKTVTVAGHVRYDAERAPDGHADRFWALALAVHAGDTRTVPIEFQAAGRRRMGADAWGWEQGAGWRGWME